MANRTMQAKALKLKKQKRLFPKKYSAGYVSVGSGYQKELASMLRGRISGEAHAPEFQAYVDGQKTVSVQMSVGKLITNRRIQALKSADSEANHQAALLAVGQDKVHWPIKFKIIENIYQRAVCYANSGQTCYVIVYENFKTGLVQRSITYASKQRILSQYYADKITWVVIKDSS